MAHNNQIDWALRLSLRVFTGNFSGAPKAWATQREDGSWLVDGLMPVTEFKARLSIKELPDEDRGIYNTVAGLVMAISGELPAVGDVVTFGEWRFEVVDLDGRRIDKLLVSRLT